MNSYLKLLRPHHYVKNLLIFTALVCSGQLLDATKILVEIHGFIAFCATSSMIYILNDIQDVEKDRQHPKKMLRPIASGKISISNAWIVISLLGGVVLVVNIMICNLYGTLLLVLYIILNLGYSYGLKNVPILDVSILVSGFLIRIMYGSILADIVVSNWLYLTVIAASFYFALGKRRNELLRLSDGETRKVLKKYPESFLDRNMYMCLALTNAFYSMWSMDEKTTTHYNNANLVVTVPLVLLITMRYSFDLEHASDGDPVEVLIHDNILLLMCGIYVVIMFRLLYC